MLGKRPDTIRKRNGQYLTPPSAAFFMVEQLGVIHNGDRILEPALGSGTLLCAVIESLIQGKHPLEVELDGYEVDSVLFELATENISRAVHEAAQYGIKIRTRLHNADFVAQLVGTLQPSLFDVRNEDSVCQYEKIIANPPYAKLDAQAPLTKLLKDYTLGTTNLYTVFMGLAVSRLSPTGRASFLVPRSFCSGAYFTEFRRRFLEQTILRSVHLFDSRRENFEQANILQENLIITFDRRGRLGSLQTSDPLTISTSATTDDLPERQSYVASRKSIIGKQNGNLFLRFPKNRLDEHLIEIMDSWSGYLQGYGWEVSTGPVVAFRSREYLLAEKTDASVPLLWLQNIYPLTTKWPIEKGHKTKPQWMSTIGSESLLVPARNYTILRRFSAKEEARRLVAAYWLGVDWPYQWIGLENHLNYVYGVRLAMSPSETVGLAAYYCSGLADRYFRLVNGNTQVNATELRALPLPPKEILAEIGSRYLDGEKSHESIVTTTLQSANLIPPSFPILLETRYP